MYVADTSGKEGEDARAYAADFGNGLLAALGTVATLPGRFAAAEESRHLAMPLVRAMPHQHRPGGPVWRVLYRVFEADENEAARVEVVAIRHAAQRPLIRREGRAIDAANQG